MDIISVYTRAQAIEDGQLIDLTEWARETGFRYPVAVTTGVWAYIEPPADAAGQDVRGRAHDVLYLLFVAIKRSRGGSRVEYKVTFQQGPRKRETVDLYSVCGPGDSAEPVITIMLTNED